MLSIHNSIPYRESVVGSLIQATRTVEFEDGSPPWRLLVPLWWLHLSQDQFCTTQGVRVGHKGGVVVKRTPVRPNSDSAKFHAWVVLNYSSYVVLE